jgi:NitT/TauT family transport system permease protein
MSEPAKIQKIAVPVQRNVVRPEFLATRAPSTEFGVVEKPLTTWEKVYNNGSARKVAILILLAVAWEVYGRLLNNSLLFPTFSSVIEALVTGILSGGLIGKCLFSIKVLLMGYAAGLALAALLTVFAITSRIGRDFLETLTSMFNPLPAIALLPLALLWFGLGTGSLVFVLVHSVVWAVALNTHSGFQSVSNTLRMVGQNYELRGLRYVTAILIPAAFPSILTGLKIGWAFAWRTLIAAELVFGVSSGTGGLGWFIYENKNQLEIPSVFAGLLTVIMIGLLVENFIFRLIEQATVQKWGMQN